MITFSCQCGKALRAKDEIAGKRVRCPACSQVVAVPRGAEGGSPSLAAEGPAKEAEGSPSLCPQCHVELPPGAVLCTTCGLDLRTGKKAVGRRSLLERIPWGTVRSVGSGILLLAILVGIIYLAMGVMSRPSSSGGSTQGEGEKGPPAPAPPARHTFVAPTFVRVQCVAKGPEPALPEAFVFQGADGDYTAKKLTGLLATRLTREAADALYLAGHKVVRKGEGKPPASAEELTLVVDAELVWVYQERDGRREPKAAWVTSCVARLVRANGVTFWENKERHRAERSDTPARQEDLGRLASLKSVRAEVDYDKYADQVASAVAGAAFGGFPSPAIVADRLAQERAAEQTARQLLADLDGGKADLAKAAQLVAEGNPYLLAGLSKQVEKIKDPGLLAAVAGKATDREVAQRAAERYVKTVGTGPRASAAASALARPEKLLVGPLRASFTKASGSFAADLPLLDATGKRMPHVALAFARIASRIEQDASVKQAYRTLCIELEAKKPPITQDEIALLTGVAEAEPASALARTAMLTLLETRGLGAESPALLYLCKVAAKRVPDLAEPWPDGGLRLSDEQMAMVQGIAHRGEKLAEVTAIALLLRVGGEQREKIRKLIKCIPPFDDPVLGPVLTDLRSDDPTKVRNVIAHGIPHDGKSYPLAPLMADAYYKHTDPTTRATALYGLFCSGGLSDPYKWALFSMLESPDPVERRAAAASFARIGWQAAFFIGELRTALAKQTDPQTRRALESAIGQASAALGRMIAQRDAGLGK